jgi:hypothetical protein
VPWEGHFREHAERDGLRVPLQGEVGWYDRGAWECVFRGRLTAARYERARSAPDRSGRDWFRTG